MVATPNLQRKLQQTLGAEAAGDLTTWMQSMDGHRMGLRERTRFFFLAWSVLLAVIVGLYVRT